MNIANYSKIPFALSAALLGMLTGCVGYVDEPHPAARYVPPPPDEYVYYPGYQVYYSGNRHQYIYQDGRHWVTRPRPPRVSAQVLLTAPSVRLDFHDAPSRHHAEVVQQYPRQWRPSAGEADDHGNGNHDHKPGKQNRGRQDGRTHR